MPPSSSLLPPPSTPTAPPLRNSVRLCLAGLAVLLLGFAGGLGFDTLRNRSQPATDKPSPSSASSDAVDTSATDPGTTATLALSNESLPKRAASTPKTDTVPSNTSTAPAAEEDPAERRQREIAALLAESRAYLDEVRRATEATPATSQSAALSAAPGQTSSPASKPTAASSTRAAAPAPASVRPAASQSASGFAASASPAAASPKFSQVLAAYNSDKASGILHRVSLEKKQVALTFDDGPSPGKTRRLMDLLESRNVTATFFFIGRQVEQYPELVREAERRGFELANHSQDHLDLRRAAAETARREIDLCQKAFIAAGVAAPRLVRFPYGNSTAALRDSCRSQGLAMIGWDIDTRDWEPNATADSIVRKVIEQTGPGSILLMHERPEATFQALPRILDFLQRQGYTCVTVTDLLRAGYAEGESAKTISSR